ncbi:MAG: hypothetical protein MI741_12460 [Rhodospirillales bacterium]|nr:hypothetical protein [Rhodospirillales bacterium]
MYLQPRNLLMGMTVAALGAVGAGSAWAQNAGECPKLPQISWWLSDPVKVATYIENKHDGDWQDYIDKWERHQAQMQKLYDEGTVAVLRKAGVKLKGQRLRAHIQLIADRVEALRCLAGIPSSEDRDILQLADFATAAGPADQPIQSDAPIAPPLSDELVTTRLEAPASRLNLEITTQCRGPDVVFRITNRGEPWIANAVVSVHRLSSQEQLTSRELRLTTDQGVSFKVKRSRRQGEVFGVWVDPSWYSRAFQYDGTAGCLPRTG